MQTSHHLIKFLCNWIETGWIHTVVPCSPVPPPPAPPQPPNTHSLSMPHWCTCEFLQRNWKLLTTAHVVAHAQTELQHHGNISDIEDANISRLFVFYLFLKISVDWQHKYFLLSLLYFIRIPTSRRPFSFLCQSEQGQDFTCRPPCLSAKQTTRELHQNCQQTNNWPAAGGR